MEPCQTLSKEERRQLRVEISMLHRKANQLQDMPDPACKMLARAAQLEAEALRLMLRRAV
jgi:hypothetical protein